MRACVNRYRRSPEPTEDLMQVGYLGLVKAINKFDPSFGRNLAAYAQPCITGELKRYFRDKRWQVHAERPAPTLEITARSAGRGGDYPRARPAGLTPLAWMPAWQPIPDPATAHAPAMPSSAGPVGTLLMISDLAADDCGQASRTRPSERRRLPGAGHGIGPRLKSPTEPGPRPGT